MFEYSSSYLYVLKTFVSSLSNIAFFPGQRFDTPLMGINIGKLLKMD